jgi:DNA-binding NtrC family response regulator
MNALKILVLDDETTILERIKNFLSREGYSVVATNKPFEAFETVAEQQIDLMFCDVMMPEMNGLDALKRVKEINPSIEVVMISAYGDMDTVIRAMREGAIDFLKKPFSIAELEMAIERTCKYMRLQSDLKQSEDQRSLISRQLESMIQRDFIGNSEAIQKVRDIALLAAKDKDVNILITGENGTGKEIVARIIHYASERHKKAFYPVNSAAIPETLLESEFFGHVKGAFTDARENKKGCFELANGGTLFLDEISEMPVSLQAKLLRAIEDSKIKPVGGNKEIEVDLRLICATNKDMKKMVAENKFRMDLFHRINTLMIHIPPLRERKEDIEPLLNYFNEKFAKKKNIKLPVIEEGLVEELMNYPFPGNVRELKNMVERAIILTEGKALKTSDFVIQANHVSTPVEDDHVLTMDEVEKKAIIHALKACNFNKVKAARALGISRDTLLRKSKKYKIFVEKDIGE